MKFATALCLLVIASGAMGGAKAAPLEAVDAPVLVAWNRVGDISLGEPRARVETEYGSVGNGYHVLQRYGNVVQGYYRLHDSRVIVTFYGDRVGELSFTTRYYRTKGGFGVGNRIPVGPCHLTATSRCEHRWHGFIYNPRLREDGAAAGLRSEVAPEHSPRPLPTIRSRGSSFTFGTAASQASTSP